jgi:uncharacterized protein (DUF4213/DUF364 family)
MNMMKILNDLISTVNKNAAVRDIRQGVFHTAVVTEKCGLASTLPHDALKQDQPFVKDAGLLLQKELKDLLLMTGSENILEAVIGMATLNSLIEIDEARCIDLNARELLIEKGKDKKIAIIGHFPFIPVLRETAREVRVIEKNPREGDHNESSAAEFIPQSDVIAITGTAFTNHTLEYLLNLCKPDSFILMLGDTTPLSPVLFDYGIDALCGTMVVDTEQVLRCVSQGANYRKIKGIRQLTMLKNANKSY